MKKLLVLAALIIASLCLLASCGGQKDDHTHEFGEWITTKNATCTEDGVMSRYCSCGEKQTEVIVALGHTPGEAVEENRIEATCYSEGSYDTVVYCKDCGAELERTKHTIPMIEHTPAEAVEENRINATCTANGSYDEVVYCSNENCKTQIGRTTKVIDKLDHSFADGACTICGEIDPDYAKPDYSVGLEYTLNKDNEIYSVTGLGTCTDTDIVIPATYKDLPVTSIG